MALSDFWTAGNQYVAGELVLSPAGAYSPVVRSLIRAKSDFIAGASFTTTNWTWLGDLTLNSYIIPTNWAAATAYAQYQVVILPTGGRAYSTTSRTSGATWDATERDAWTFIPGGHYELLTSAATGWKCPVGIAQSRNRLVGAGGSGASAGSASSALAQGAAGGGSCAVEQFAEIRSLVAGTTYACSIGAAAAGPAGGTASGHTGVNGANGADTTFTGPGAVVYTSRGGFGGKLSGTNTATVGNGGLYGSGAGSNGAATFYPGSGGAGAIGAYAIGTMCGGTGGVAATTTQGGNGGSARLLTAPGAEMNAPSGTTGATTGGNGISATEYGCGGGGGGGGAWNAGTGPGAGGNGGDGAQGCIEVWF